MKMSEKRCICYIDCRIDRRIEYDFLTLVIWGKPVYEYVIEAAYAAKIFERIVVVTDSEKIIGELRDKVNIENEISFDVDSNCICILSGCAPLITPKTLKKALCQFTEGIMYSTVEREETDFTYPVQNILFRKGRNNSKINIFAFYTVDAKTDVIDRYSTFKVKLSESVVINNTNDFELAIVLKKKELNRSILRNNILERIEEKKNVIMHASKNPSICLIGHSQLDFWEVDELAGLEVRNCGIGGISSFEYNKLIFEKDLMNYSADAFVIMHGTNDIVLEFTFEEIMESIKQTLEYIRASNKESLIFFVSCIHINGRIDRNNKKIDKFNESLYYAIKDQVVWINTSFMDDGLGDLKNEFTTDGLHLSKEGYKELKSHLEEIILENM
jgi:N-acylneuraminate cytidylyltransferase